MSTEQLLKILQDYSNIFNLDTILGRTMRELFWGIVKVLGYIVDSISAITDKLFVLDRFYNDPHVVDFVNSVKPLIVVLFALSLLGVGYQLMFSQTKQFKKIGTNILVAMAVILVLPMAMDKMNALTNIGVTAVKGSPSSLTNQITKSNTIDVLLYDKLNFKKDDINALKSPNEIDEKNIRYIDPTSIIEPDFINTSNIKNKDVFGVRISTDTNGKLNTEKLNQGWMTFWKEYYYRYNINFLNIIVSLGVIGATLAFTCFKLAKMIFELGYNKFLAILIAPADINDGQKTKQIIQNIMSTFIVTFLIAVLLKFYVMFVAVCAKASGIEGVILLVAGSFAVIDGPNLVEKLFGIDAGLKSGFKTMAGAYMAGSAVMGGAKSIGKTAKNLAGGAGKIAGSALGAGAGIASGLNNKKSDSLYKDMDKDKQKKSTDANKGKSLYKDMAKAKGNENKSKGNGVNSGNSNTSNPNKKEGNSSNESTKKNGDQGHQSLYDEMGKDSDSNMYTQNPDSNSLYEEMGKNNPDPINSNNGEETNSNEGDKASGHITSNNTPEPIQSSPNSGGNSINGQPKTNRKISDNSPKPINSNNVGETSSNGGNETSGHITSNNTPEPIQSAPSSGGDESGGQPNTNINIPNNTPEPISSNRGEVSNNEGNGHIVSNNTPDPIQHNNENVSHQTIGQHQKQVIMNKVQNNPIIKQTRESYNRGKNTGQSIRNKNK